MSCGTKCIETEEQFPYSAVEPGVEGCRVWVVARGEEPEPDALVRREVSVPRRLVHARRRLYKVHNPLSNPCPTSWKQAK